MQIYGLRYLEFILFHNGCPLQDNINVFDGNLYNNSNC